MGSSSKLLEINTMFRAFFFSAVIVGCLANPFGLRNSESRDNIQSIIEETRHQANAVKSTLKKLASHNKASQYMKKIFTAGECVHSLDEAIEAIESGTRIIEASGPQLRGLISTINRIGNPSDILEVTKSSADLLRKLEALMPNLIPSKLDVCGSSFDATFGTMESVGEILNKVSNDNSLELSKLTALQLKQSKVIVDSVNAFLEELRDIFTDLKTQCTSQQGYNIKSLKAINKMMERMAELFINLGEVDTAKEVREGASFTRKITAAIENFPESDFGSLDCNSPDNFETTARMLEDLVKLIQEIGLEKLQKQIGIQGLF